MTNGLDRHSPDKLTGTPSPSRGKVKSGARWPADGEAAKAASSARSPSASTQPSKF
jgi:hypothetical protein